jgi:hypothetical protein
VPLYRPPSAGGLPRTDGGSRPAPQLNSEASAESTLGSSGRRMSKSPNPFVLAPVLLISTRPGWLHLLYRRSRLPRKRNIGLGYRYDHVSQIVGEPL